MKNKCIKRFKKIYVPTVLVPLAGQAIVQSLIMHDISNPGSTIGFLQRLSAFFKRSKYVFQPWLNFFIYFESPFSLFSDFEMGLLLLELLLLLLDFDLLLSRLFFVSSSSFSS